MAEATGRTGAKFRQIADDLRARIEAGEFGEDGRIPSKDQLHEQYGAATNTVERAIEELRREGRLVTEWGSGSFVRTPAEPEPDPERAQIRERLDAIEAYVMEIYMRMGWPHPAQRQAHENGKARHEQAG